VTEGNGHLIDPNGEARRALLEAVAEHGPEALSDVVIMDNVCRDHLTGLPGESTLIASAARTDVPALLRDLIPRLGNYGAIQSAAATLAEENELDTAACLWVVREFARALGHIAPGPAPGGSGSFPGLGRQPNAGSASIASETAMSEIPRSEAPEGEARAGDESAEGESAEGTSSAGAGAEGRSAEGRSAGGGSAGGGSGIAEADHAEGSQPEGDAGAGYVATSRVAAGGAAEGGRAVSAGGPGGGGAGSPGLPPQGPGGPPGGAGGAPPERSRVFNRNTLGVAAAIALVAGYLGVAAVAHLSPFPAKKVAATSPHSPGTASSAGRSTSPSPDGSPDASPDASPTSDYQILLTKIPSSVRGQNNCVNTGTEVGATAVSQCTSPHHLAAGTIVYYLFTSSAKLTSGFNALLKTATFNKRRECTTNNQFTDFLIECRSDFTSATPNVKGSIAEYTNTSHQPIIVSSDIRQNVMVVMVGTNDGDLLAYWKKLNWVVP
jgi:hypothetical protein